MLTRPRLRSGNASRIKTTGSFLGVIMRFHRSHVFWPLFLSRFSGFPDLLRDAQPGAAKGALGYREVWQTALIFIPQYLTLYDKINTALFLWLMIWSWDTGQKVLIPVLVPFGRFARRRPTRPSSKLPGECGGIFRAVKKIVRKILVRKILVRKILGHLIAVAAPETVL